MNDVNADDSSVSKDQKGFKLNFGGRIVHLFSVVLDFAKDNPCPDAVGVCFSKDCSPRLA